MQAATRFDFTPPAQPPGLWRAVAIAIAAHTLLVAALTWGVSWKRSSTELAVQAELWSALPQEAAPKAVEPPPPPPPPPPVVAPPPRPAPPPEQPNADIALARQKKELEKQAIEKKAAAKLAQEKTQREKQESEQKKKAAEDKKRQDQKAAQEARRKEAAELEKAEKELEAQRQANLRRMASLAGTAGASGDDNARGNALRSSGPSTSYGGRIRARIKPNIVFSDDVAGNPTAEVEVRAAPDGTIVGRKLIKTSGVKAWDEAVLKAIDKTETLPRDEDGRVPPLLVISFKPRD